MSSHLEFSWGFELSLRPNNGWQWQVWRERMVWGKVKCAKLQDCAGTAATERLRPGRELWSRAVDTFPYQVPGWGFIPGSLPCIEHWGVDLCRVLLSPTSQDKKVTPVKPQLENHQVLFCPLSGCGISFRRILGRSHYSIPQAKWVVDLNLK